jgi:hypothetical protein
MLWLLGLVVIGAATTCRDLINTAGGEMNPIRFKIILSESSSHSTESDYVRTVLVPHAVGFFQAVLKTRSVVGDLELNANGVRRHRNGEREPVHVCSGHLMPRRHSDADIAVLVVVEECSGFMAAKACGKDACGRPTSGLVRICKSAIGRHLRRPGGEEMLAQAMIHEFFHVVGFDKDLFHRFLVNGVDRATDGQVRNRTVRYTCRKNREGRFSVRWGLSEADASAALARNEKVFNFRFPGPVARAVSARGLRAEDCRCPIDPEKAYTHEDIEYCLRHPNHCAIAVTTPKVAEKAQEYYNCPSLEGQELENGRTDCGTLIESHWKVRTLKTEIMNFITTESIKFVSPMTLALLEDSGWYSADYSGLNSRIVSASYGYRAGCEFVVGKCFTDSGEPVDDRVFCRKSESGHRRCSMDSMRINTCDAGDGRNSVWRSAATLVRSKSGLSAYAYGPDLHEPRLQVVDYCPTYEGDDNENCALADPNSRCLETDSGRPSCLRIACSQDARSYKVGTDSVSTVCRSEGAEIRLGQQTIVCRDPAVVCADWRMSHISSKSAFNRIPHAQLPALRSSAASLHTLYAVMVVVVFGVFP